MKELNLSEEERKKMNRKFNQGSYYKPCVYCNKEIYYFKIPTCKECKKNKDFGGEVS